MDQLVEQLLQHASLTEIAGLVMVLGLALYGATGIGDDDGLDNTGNGE